MNMEDLHEKNKPTNPDLWSQAISKAKSKFDVYPSAYANAWASKWYKEQGGGWRSKKKEESVNYNDIEETVEKMTGEIADKIKGEMKKRLNNPNATVKDYAKSAKESVELQEQKFSKAQIDRMRKEYSSLGTIDPSQPTYKRLTELLDNMSDEQLKQLAQAKIKFVSSLALNRVNKRKMKKESVELNENKFREVLNRGKKLGDWNMMSYFLYQGNVWMLQSGRAVNQGALEDFRKRSQPGLLKSIGLTEALADRQVIRQKKLPSLEKKTTNIALVLPNTPEMQTKIDRVLEFSASTRNRMNKLVTGRENRGKDLVLYFRSAQSRKKFQKMLNAKSDWTATESVELDEASEKDHEYSMARSQLSTIEKAVMNLKKKMKGEGNLEAWVQSKLTKAADYIDSVSDYIDSGEHDIEESNLEEKLNDPVRTSGGPKKFMVKVKDPSTGNEKTVRFGDPNMEIKRDDPERRKSFRARHNCENPGPKTKARYWSCRMWEKGKKVSELD